MSYKVINTGEAIRYFNNNESVYISCGSDKYESSCKGFQSVDNESDIYNAGLVFIKK